MRKLTLITIVLCLVAPLLSAGEKSCPADRAGKEGYNPIGEFHEVLAPCWHESWPNKDYDALIASAPKFVARYDGIAGMKPTFKTEAKAERFQELRDQLGKHVRAFAEAAKAGDKEKVYKIMPDLHDSFEMTASSLLPVDYPELTGVIITLNLILTNHIPVENTEGILGSTETLVAKMGGLSEESIPDELREHSDDILKRFEAIKADVNRMKECCDKSDMAGLKTHAEELSAKLDEFTEKYI